MPWMVMKIKPIRAFENKSSRDNFGKKKTYTNSKTDTHQNGFFLYILALDKNIKIQSLELRLYQAQNMIGWCVAADSRFGLFLSFCCITKLKMLATIL